MAGSYNAEYWDGLAERKRRELGLSKATQTVPIPQDSPAELDADPQDATYVCVSCGAIMTDGDAPAALLCLGCDGDADVHRHYAGPGGCDDPDCAFCRPSDHSCDGSCPDRAIWCEENPGESWEPYRGRCNCGLRYVAPQDVPVADPGDACAEFSLGDVLDAIARTVKRSYGAIGDFHRSVGAPDPFCDYCDVPATWAATSYTTNPYDGSPMSWTSRYCDRDVNRWLPTDGALTRRERSPQGFGAGDAERVR